MTRRVVDRYVRVSDRDSFLTPRRLAETEGMLLGGSCGLAVHAALEVAKGIDDPEALIAVVLPDGGRAYLSKIFNDAWISEYGFLDRPDDKTVGDVFGPRPPPARSRSSSSSGRTRRCARRSRCCTSSASPSCRWSRPTTTRAIVGSVGERGLLSRAIGGAVR